MPETVRAKPGPKDPHMSRFAIRDMGTTVAAGLCLEIGERTST